MSTYAFRITCKLAGDYFALKENTSLAFPAPAPPIHVMLGKSKDWTNSSTLILQGGGFSSEKEARAAGIPVKTAVLLTGLLLGVGIDVGVDQVLSPAPQRRDGGQPDERWQPDVHGLQVVPELDRLTFGFGYLSRPVLKRPISHSDLEEKVAESYAPDKALTKKQTLAAQLYSQSHFHLSDAARFLTLISAIEALAERQRRAPATVVLVNRMIEETAIAGDLEQSERKSLTDGLGNLKRESITSACRRLVKTHCGDPAVEAFTRAYRIRSELLHNGEPSPETNLTVEVLRLDPLVRGLIVHHVASSWRS
jgi:hypothetical protein